jgi:hypothetical protein
MIRSESARSGDQLKKRTPTKKLPQTVAARASGMGIRLRHFCLRGATSTRPSTGRCGVAPANPAAGRPITRLRSAVGARWHRAGFHG